MTRGILSSFTLVRPALSAFAFSPENLRRIETIASTLPSIHSAGFECSLVDRNGTDFQQGITLSKANMAAVGVFLANQDQRSSPGWIDTLKYLFKDWQGSNSYSRAHFEQLWLEFDCAASQSQSPDPSLFLGFKSPAKCRDAHVWLSKTMDVLRVNHHEPPRPGTLNNIASLEGLNIGITHIGLMLGRETAPLRIVMSVENQEQIRKLPNSVNKALETGPSLSWFFENFAEIRLCLDITESGFCTPALECFFDSNSQNQSATETVLGEIVDAELCDFEVATALLSWPQTITPYSSEFPWPEDLITQSLQRSEKEFSVVQQRLSHLKFSFLEGSGPSVKAYFGYFQSWIDLATQENG